ncbi:MAG TPA: HAD-IIIC family phosphatase, partial [Streptosporangiaceae bacterium]
MRRAHGPARPADDTPAVPAALVKCVVWDIDNTLLTGVYLESGEDLPGADPVMAGVLAELGRRGILQAVASKNPPAAAAHAARVTGGDFAAVECGWGAKSAALTRIADSLAIGADTLAFVDDDPYERAEVSTALPQVRVLAPEEAAEAVRWPEFNPPVLTEEGRRRGELYAARRRRLAAERGFGGSRDEFLRSVGTRVTIAAATAADAARLHELAARTRQFNSAARVVDEAAFAAMIADDEVVTVRLRDTFSDDGIVGGCVLARRPPASSW